jgi:hypothetical protein
LAAAKLIFLPIIERTLREPGIAGLSHIRKLLRR